jgi:L-2-hydroxyglutarate oxidase LhgO
MPARVDIVIIGAGVVGLAVAARLADRGDEVLLLEKNDSFGQETSSRHSGVIHCGIYYPSGSLKAKLCLAGNKALYDLCVRYGIGHKHLGKLIVATAENELGQLEALLERGRDNGVEGLRLISSREMKRLEPNVSGEAAIFAPSTGIIDAHTLMKCFLGLARRGGVQVAYRSKVSHLEKVSGGYRLAVAGGEGDFSFTSRLVINCAGLHADTVAALTGIDIDAAGYRLHYCKGDYFIINGQCRPVKRLIYPLPPANLSGAGIHITLDLEGRLRLGPGVRYVDRIDYGVDAEYKCLFYGAVRLLLPWLEYEDIEPEMTGIRPKLQGPGQGFRDFVIAEESSRGLPGLINLIGIESPGLTSCPAIADYVADLVGKL